MNFQVDGFTAGYIDIYVPKLKNLYTYYKQEAGANPGMENMVTASTNTGYLFRKSPTTPLLNPRISQTTNTANKRGQTKTNRISPGRSKHPSTPQDSHGPGIAPRMQWSIVRDPCPVFEWQSRCLRIAPAERDSAGRERTDYCVLPMTVGFLRVT